MWANLRKRGLVKYITTFGVSSAAYLYVKYNSQNNKDKRTLNSRGAFVEFDFRNPIAEAPLKRTLQNLFQPSRPPFHDIVQAIERAANDNNVKGIIATIESVSNYSQAHELGEAIKKFNESGKPSIAFSDSMDQSGYYLASSFRNVYLQPSGHIHLLGFYSHQFFFKEALDKLGIEPKFLQNDAYKTAPNQFTQRGFTEQHKDQVNRIVDTKYQLLVNWLSVNRKISPELVEKAIDEGPFSSSLAQQFNIIDGAHYQDEVLTKIQKEYPKVPIIPADRYLNATNSPKKNRPNIALVFLEGNIVSGAPNEDQIQRGLRAARSNPNVKAIVVRVNCPGGDAIAADILWRDMVVAKQSGKPIVVSVGETSASGGYYSVVPADYIFGSEQSHVGSIGVFSGSFGIDGLLETLGVDVEGVQRGKHARLNAVFGPTTEEDRDKLEELVNEVQERFVSRVKEGRNFSEEKSRMLATGEVWIGREAKELGLIDEIGGLSDAIAKAREMARDPSLPVVVYPQRKVQLGETLEYPFNSNSEHPPRSSAFGTFLSFLFK